MMNLSVLSTRALKESFNLNDNGERRMNNHTIKEEKTMQKSKSYYDEFKRAVAFISMLESHTDDWDELCDCGLDNDIHKKDCRTMNLRVDCHYAVYGEKFK